MCAGRVHPTCVDPAQKRALRHCRRTRRRSGTGAMGSAANRADPSDLLVVRRSFGRIALGLAQRELFFLLSLLFLGLCARCPLPFGSVSAVIWLECHWNPLMRRVAFVAARHIYDLVRVLPVLVICPV